VSTGADAETTEAVVEGRLARWRSHTEARVANWRVRADDASERYENLAARRPVFGLPLFFVARYTSRQGMLLASAVAFRLYLWLMPLALLAAGILAGIARSDAKSVADASKSAGVTGAATQEVVAQLQAGGRSWWVAVGVGLVLVLWTTRTLMRNLVQVNAHAWHTRAPKARQKDVVMTTLLFLGLWAVVLAGDLFLHKINHLVAGGTLLALAAQVGVLGGAWLMISLKLPDTRRSWTDLLPGAVIVAVCMAVLNVVSRVYLPYRLARSAALYGALGGAAAILAWMLIVGQVIVCACVANSIWSDFRARRRLDDPPDDRAAGWPATPAGPIAEPAADAARPAAQT
jgi:membrane protein